MPVAAITAAATVGGAIYSANSASNAQDKALNAQNQATQQQIAAQQQALQQITALQQPYINAGYGAMGQLANLYGYGGAPTTAGGGAIPYAGAPSGNYAGPTMMVAGQNDPAITAQQRYISSPAAGSAFAPPSSGTPSTTSNTPATGGGAYVGGVPVTSPGTSASPGTPDWDAYIKANPDVAAWIAQGHGDPNNPNQTPEQAAAYHYLNGGQAEGRTVSYLPGTATTGTPATVGQTPADAALSAAIGASPERPTQPQTPDFGSAPTQASYFSNFQADPGYQWNLNNALRAANANYGARGLLQSDAAAKGIMAQAQGLAEQTYQDWFNRQNTLYSEATNQFNTDRNTNFNIFNTNRNVLNTNYQNDLSQWNNSRDYATNRYDNTANNLFRVASLGTGAAGSVAGANTNYANAASGIYGNQGNNAANAALANGSTQAQLGGTLAGVGANLANTMVGNLSTPIPLQSYSNPVATAIPASAANTNYNFMSPFSFSSGGI